MHRMQHKMVFILAISSENLVEFLEVMPMKVDLLGNVTCTFDFDRHYQLPSIEIAPVYITVRNIQEFFLFSPYSCQREVKMASCGCYLHFSYK